MNNDLNRCIDYTLLKAVATQKDIEDLCETAMRNNFYSVCVQPCNVTLAKNLLEDSEVKVCTVVGFPLGSNTNKIKVLETKIAVEDGADEIDMVMNIGYFKSHLYKEVREEIEMVVQAAGERIVKVIIETAYLNYQEMALASKIVEEAGAHYIKTSTGMLDGAKSKDILKIKAAVSSKMKIKASGGIGTIEIAKRMISAGADRLGTSSKVFDAHFISPRLTTSVSNAKISY